MKVLRKFIGIIVSVILILILLAVLAVNIFANRAIKIAIEAIGTKTLGVGVSIKDVDLSIIKGQIVLQGLVIDNPVGYQHEKFLQLAEVKIKANIKSFLSDTVRIELIRLDGMDIVLEQRGVASNNIQDILKNLPKRKEAKEPQQTEPPGKKLIIKELHITASQVKAKLLPVPGKADTVTIKLNPITLRNLGEKNTIDIAAVMSEVMFVVSSAITEQGVDLLPEDLTKAMKAAVDKAIDLGKTATEEGKKIIESGKEITEGLKGLFEKSKR